LILIVAFLAHEPGAAINVPDLRALGTPSPFFVAAPIQDSACLLVRNGGRAWLVNAGREAPAPSIPGRLLQFYGINRLDGLILAQVSVPDNGGAPLMARQFHPRSLIIPALESRSPWRREIPGLAQATSAPVERWQRGSSYDLGPGLSVDVLNPAPDSTETRGDDRSLVLLFHAGRESLLWAGRTDPTGQDELMRAYPGLRADVIVLGADSVPDAAWLKSLGVRYWLRIPPRQKYLNSSAEASAQSASCQLWPLDQTGAVWVHFTDGGDGWPAGIFLQPWTALPAAQK
jgi:hypothetical protein